jgi:putative sigma-54 modulation protein
VPVPVARCPACRGRLSGARQAVGYAAAAPALVGALKDGRRRVLAAVLAERIAVAVPAPPLGAVLVPVPLGPRRLGERGFNQSLLIARELGERWRRPVAEALRRAREEPAQRGSAATARARQAAGAFAPSGRVPGRGLADGRRGLLRPGPARPMTPRGRGSRMGGGPEREVAAVQLQVKGRNTSVTDALFDHAEQKLERLARIMPPWDDAMTVELELSVEKNPKVERPQIAEVTVRTKGPVLRVRERADDMYAAIDQAARKLERQARRYRDRRKAHGGRPPAGEAAAAPASGGAEAAVPVEDAEGEPRLMRRKTFDMKPMTAEEAALNMEMLGHEFYVFRNEDGEVNVVYLRRDGNYGLIAPG